VYVIIGGPLSSSFYKPQYKSDGDISVLCKFVYLVVMVLVATTCSNLVTMSLMWGTIEFS